MRILHYALGFPPYRTGGLTRYVVDLAEEQQRHGDTVAMLWPGATKLRGNRPIVRERRRYHLIRSYELCNPLPVVLDKQVSDPEAFIQPANRQDYVEFLQAAKPDIIHIHTLQGLHKEFIDAASELGIPTVFTTHDFFGLYPMNAIYPMDHILNDYESSVINRDAPSVRHIRIMQSGFVRFVKGSSLMRRCVSSVLSLHHVSDKGKDNKENASIHDIEVKPYHKFREYETSLINQLDCILYNSSVSKGAYERFCQPKSSKVLFVTHSSLPSRQWIRKKKTGSYNIAFLGGDRPYKGLDFLLKAFRTLGNDKNRYVLNVFGLKGTNTDNVMYRPKFIDFEKTMNDMDAVVVPSVTFESFGFVVLESLLYGVPVLVSDVVGAKDLLEGHENHIFSAGNSQDFIEKLQGLTCSSSQTIKIERSSFEMDKHYHDLRAIYLQYIGEGRNA